LGGEVDVVHDLLQTPWGIRVSITVSSGTLGEVLKSTSVLHDVLHGCGLSLMAKMANFCLWSVTPLSV